MDKNKVGEGTTACALIESVRRGATSIVTECTIIYNDNGEKKTVNVLRSEWAELGCGAGDFIDEDTLAELLLCAIVCEAALCGYKLLGYGDNSVRALSDKLRRRGYGRDVAERAAAAIEAGGYINEPDQIKRRGRNTAERKLRGMRRVIDDLYTLGYRRENIDRFIKDCDIDFGEICARAIERRGGIPEDADGKRNLMAYLYRQGFCSDDIKRGAAILRE